MSTATSSRSAAQAQAGFTALEWLIAVLIAAVVLTAAIVGLRSVQLRKQSEGIAQEIAADLAFARTAAMGSARPVHLLTTTDGQGYRVLICESLQECAADTPVHKVVSLPRDYRVTPARRFAFNAPRGLLAAETQSVCVIGPAPAPQLKVELRQSLSHPQLCAVGEAAGALPACSSGC